MFRFRIDFGIAELPPEVGLGDMRGSVESYDVTGWVCNPVLASGRHTRSPRSLVSELLQYSIRCMPILDLSVFALRMRNTQLSQTFKIVH